MRRTDENEEDSKAGEVDNMRWMFMRASSTKTFHRAPFLAVCRIRTRRAAARATSGAAADLVTLPSESDLCVLPMNHLTRVVRRRRIGRCPPSPNSFSFSPTSNSVMNMEMKLSPPPPLPLYFFLIPFLFPVWESPVSSLSLFLPLSGQVLMNEREEEG